MASTEGHQRKVSERHRSLKRFIKRASKFSRCFLLLPRQRWTNCHYSFITVLAELNVVHIGLLLQQVLEEQH
jgi:hypothetical protein